MPDYAAELPDVVRARVAARGAAGRAWLSGLDATVETLSLRWGVTPGGVLHGGSEALVLDVACADDTRAVLKLCLPDNTGIVNERLTLRLAAGRGYAKLLQEDEESGALLLERLGPTVANAVEGDQAQMTAIVETLKHAWVPMRNPRGLTSTAAKADWLERFISSNWGRLGEPCARATVERAFEYARLRRDAHRPDSGFLLHGDAHEENTLADPARSGSYKLIDPDGMHGERACDLATLMRDWNGPLGGADCREVALARCHWLAETTDSEADAVWQWGLIERVSTGLVMLDLGLHAESRETLRIADELAQTAP